MFSPVFHIYETNTSGRILADVGPIDAPSHDDAVAQAITRSQQEHRMLSLWADDRLIHVTPPPSILKAFDPDTRRVNCGEVAREGQQ